jgi:hypothetical protein
VVGPFTIPTHACSDTSLEILVGVCACHPTTITYIANYVLIWIYRFMGCRNPIVAADPHPGPPIWSPGLSSFIFHLSIFLL